MNLAHDDWIRPYGLVINGVLERGLEMAIVDGVIQEIRASSHPCESFVLSPAFVNAHSHLEYRGMLNQIEHPEYYEWIYELARLKTLESPEYVREQCNIAAIENRHAGVAWIGEHSDRPGSAEAMVKHGLGGWIFQEVITSGSEDIAATLSRIERRLEETRATLSFAAEQFSSLSGSLAKRNTSLDREVGELANQRNEVPKSRLNEVNIFASLNPHAYFTVDHESLQYLGSLDTPSSIHVAETKHESNFTKYGKGPIAERRTARGVPFEVYNQSVAEVLDNLGVLRPGMQCVHCCDVDEADIAIMASRGVTIAHCPRSNVRLQSPEAPVREFLDAGITVGLGLDSPASGGTIDMFAEMRAALIVSERRGQPLTGEDVWRMATSEGFKSFGQPSEAGWDIYEGSATPVIRIDINSADSVEQLIELGNTSKVSRI